MADITWGAFPVRMVDLSSCQNHVAQPVQMLHFPVSAGVGEQVGGAGLGGAQAGDVEHGFAVAHDPAAVLLDRDVALQEDGLAGAGEAQVFRGGQDADCAGLDPAAADLAGRGRDRDVLPVQGVERGIGSRLVAQHRQQVERVLVLGQPAGVLALGLHRVGGDDHAGQGQRFQQRPEVRDLVRLAGLGDLVLADHQAGDVGDRSQQVHLLLPAGLGELAFLAVHGHRGPGRAVSRVTGDRRVQPGMAGSGPDLAIGPGLAQRRSGRRLAAPLLPPAAGGLARRGARGDPGREPWVQRRRGQARGQPGLQLISVQQGRQPAQRGRGRRLMQPGARVAAAPVRGQHLLIPARRRPGDRQHAGVPARHPRDQHRHQRSQRMPDTARPARIGQPGLQHLPQRRRRRRARPPPGSSGQPRSAMMHTRARPF